MCNDTSEFKIHYQWWEHLKSIKINWNPLYIFLIWWNIWEEIYRDFQHFLLLPRYYINEKQNSSSFKSFTLKVWFQNKKESSILLKYAMWQKDSRKMNSYLADDELNTGTWNCYRKNDRMCKAQFQMKC
jgi:hypothetical protein